MNTDDFHTRYAEELAQIGPGCKAAPTSEETVPTPARGSAPTDTQRLEWLVKSEAFVVRSKRPKTRRGGLAAENMEEYYQVDWVAEDGALCWQGADGGRLDWRDAIDAAMQAHNDPSSATREDTHG